MSERVLHGWRFAGYVCRIVETEPGIVHFEQAQGPPIGTDATGPLAFNRTEKPLGCANEIIHLSQALAEANVINRDLSKAIHGWQEDRNRRERGETTAWLIEMKDYVHPIPAWWGGSRYGWRHDANEAVRFCRQEDAERVIESMLWKHNAIATQHSWIPPMPKLADAEAERDRLKKELEEATARGPHYIRDSRLRAEGMRAAAEIARNLRPKDACTCGNYLSFRNGVPGHLPGCLVGECIDVADEIEGRAEEIDRSNRE